MCILCIVTDVKVAVSGDRNVSIDSMQNASVHVTLGTGECTLNNMQVLLFTVGYFSLVFFLILCQKVIM